MDSIEIKKVPGSNELSFSIEISPKTDVLSDFDLAEILHFRGSLLNIQEAYYDAKTGEIKITAAYEEDL